ncbi:PIN domain-containing protein [Streptomyces akebiae]|uniref:Uncharacterized protein n=1 Tax=Streptomyces akebiae TaxID=2865673 RepID=A0ABX8Y6V7_9ACTN|nr:hypothetical protein [Streptomyces akebiae]QYX83553.1 hypothetical protein K1J60_44595 [Streptomyces akebiae]
MTPTPTVVAEPTTRAKPDPRVLAWSRSTARPNRFLSVITVAEIEARLGGAACVYYWTVRFVLARDRAVPYRYGHFLGDAERRILMRRSGSGFRFPHRLIQEHIRVHAPALRERL